MSIYTNTRRGASPSLENITAGSTAVLGSIATLLFSTLALALLSVPSPLVLPSLALVSASLAAIVGTIGWRSEGRFKSDALASAGIFAFAAIVAGILGDPDQVAIFFK